MYSNKSKRYHYQPSPAYLEKKKQADEQLQKVKERAEFRSVLIKLSNLLVKESLKPGGIYEQKVEDRRLGKELMDFAKNLHLHDKMRDNRDINKKVDELKKRFNKY